MKTSMKFFVCLITAIALMAITSCQKDNLEDAVLPQTAKGGQVASGADGQNGQNGQDGAVGAQGEPGANGQDGEDGAQGEPGTDGQDGEDGAQGPIGPQGEPGTIGTDGTDGAQGPRGEQGETGPSGSQGPQGEPGINGTNGTNGSNGRDGENGEDGNANVIYSGWMNADWNITDEPKRKMMQIEVNAISLNELRNSTLVYVYFQQYGTSSIYSMNGSGRWSNVEYAFTFGDNSACCRGILIRLTSKDGADITELQYAGFRGNRFRYVLVPAHVSTAKLDFSDYEAVKAFFDLTD